LSSERKAGTENAGTHELGSLNLTVSGDILHLATLTPGQDFFACTVGDCFRREAKAVQEGLDVAYAMQRLEQKIKKAGNCTDDFRFLPTLRRAVVISSHSMRQIACASA
jgi:hypothetical protein